MEENVEELIPIRENAIFGVRNDKSRGLLIETLKLKVPNHDVFFFKYHNQPLDRHCEQVQNIVRLANVKRSKKVSVDLTEFLHEYYNIAEKKVMFKATELESVNQRIDNVIQMRVNKELGIVKRGITITSKKQAKAAKEKKDEREFQAGRATLIHKLLAGGLLPLVPASSGNVQALQGTSQTSQASDLRLVSDESD